MTIEHLALAVLCIGLSLWGRGFMSRRWRTMAAVLAALNLWLWLRA